VEPGDPDAGKLPDDENEARAGATVLSAAHRTLRDVTADYEAFHFNTMVSKLMELTNLLSRYRGTAVAGGPEWEEAIRLLLLMLAPSAPHIADELWARRLAAAGRVPTTIHLEHWPEVNAAAVAESTREVPVQINGKVRDRVLVPAGLEGTALEAIVLAQPRIQELLAGRVPVRIIHAGGGRLVNLVVAD
jgi:leucyl-tRNA synthetase